MLYYDTVIISKGININKTNKSKECDICHYWYFLEKDFKFQPGVCNKYRDILMISVIVIRNGKSGNTGRTVDIFAST